MINHQLRLLVLLSLILVHSCLQLETVTYSRVVTGGGISTVMIFFNSIFVNSHYAFHPVTTYQAATQNTAAPEKYYAYRMRARKM